MSRLGWALALAALSGCGLFPSEDFGECPKTVIGQRVSDITADFPPTTADLTRETAVITISDPEGRRWRLTYRNVGPY